MVGGSLLIILNTIMIPFEIQMRIDPIKLAVVYGIRQKTVTQHKNETN